MGALTLPTETTISSGTAGEQAGERRVTSGWLVMLRLSVALTPPLWMVQHAREDQAATHSTCVVSVVSCLTVLGPWEPMSGPSPKYSLPLPSHFSSPLTINIGPAKK